MVLKWKHIYIENIRVVPLTALRIEGIVKWRGLKLQVPLYTVLLQDVYYFSPGIEAEAMKPPLSYLFEADDQKSDSAALQYKLHISQNIQ